MPRPGLDTFNDDKMQTRNQGQSQNLYQEPKQEISDYDNNFDSFFDDIPDNSTIDNDWTYGVK